MRYTDSVKKVMERFAEMVERLRKDGIPDGITGRITFICLGVAILDLCGKELFEESIEEMKEMVEYYESKKISKKRKPGQHNADPSKNRKRVIRKTKTVSKKA